MEIAVSSAWSIAELSTYRRTRFPLAPFLTLALLLTLAAFGATPGAIPWGPLLQRLFLVLLWLFQFRLADDLADRKRDHLEHPDRVLVRADGRIFFALLAVLALVNTLLTALVLAERRWVEFMALNGLYVVWYAVRADRQTTRLLVHLMVLLKYPSFVYLLSEPASAVWRLTGVLVLIYACMVAYEVLHDQRLWKVPGSAWCLGLALSSMTLAALLPMCIEAEIFTWTPAMWVGPGSVALAWLFRKHWQRSAPRLWQYAVFVVAYLWIGCNYLMRFTF
jgi:hypothetical protein